MAVAAFLSRAVLWKQKLCNGSIHRQGRRTKSENRNYSSSSPTESILQQNVSGQTCIRFRPINAPISPHHLRTTFRADMANYSLLKFLVLPPAWNGRKRVLPYTEMYRLLGKLSGEINMTFPKAGRWDGATGNWIQTHTGKMGGTSRHRGETRFWRTQREPRATSEQERHERHCNHAHKCNVMDTLRSTAFSDGVTATWRVPKTGRTNDSIPELNIHNSRKNRPTKCTN